MPRRSLNELFINEHIGEREGACRCEPLFTRAKGGNAAQFFKKTRIPQGHPFFQQFPGMLRKIQPQQGDSIVRRGGEEEEDTERAE